MDRLTKQDVERLAVSAQLKLDDNTCARFSEELNQVLEYVQVLQDIDTEGTAPFMQASERVNIFRDDVPEDPLPLEEVFKNSPLDDGAYFLVPRIIEGEENS